MHGPRDDLVRALGPTTASAIEKLIEERIERSRSERTLLTVSEYATRVGKSERAVRARIERGQIEPVRIGRSLFIAVEADA